MDKLLAFKAWLLALHQTQAPLYFLLLVATVYAVTWLWRKCWPSFWESLERENPVSSKLFQALPVALLGIVLHGFGSNTIDVEAFWGLIGTSGAIPLHHLIKVINWGPFAWYKGELGKLVPALLAKAIGRLRSTTSLIVLLVSCTPAYAGCGLLKSAGVPDAGGWPDKIAQCAPVGDLVDVVSQVLFGSGDVKTELEQLGAKHGFKTVACLVKQLVGDWTAVGAVVTPERDHATKRAQAFLDDIGTEFPDN